ncbi:MAG: DUF2834 domain-containing protein [Microcystaceae cyanobacterium]
MINSLLLRRTSLTLLWLGLIAYAFFLAPPDNPDTLSLIINLSTGQWQGINSYIIGLFNVMGIWPMIYAALLLVDGRGQNLRAYPFVIGSFFLGAFALLPYLIFRRPNPPFTGPLDWPLKLWESKILAVLLTLGAIACGVVAISGGDWAGFVAQWQNSRFLSVMSADFLCLCLLFGTVLGDDLARRGIENPKFWMILAFMPLAGPLIYLLCRPSLPQDPLGS